MKNRFVLYKSEFDLLNRMHMTVVNNEVCATYMCIYKCIVQDRLWQDSVLCS